MSLPLILVFFLGKNTSALEAHLIDVRNSVRSPLAVGADVPDFTMEDVEGRMLKKLTAARKCVLVIGDTGCLYFLGGHAVLQRCRELSGYLLPLRRLFRGTEQSG